MTGQRIKRRLVRIAAATGVFLCAIGAGVLVAPAPASAVTCSSGAFCYYNLQYQGGDYAEQYYYTSGYVWVPALWNASESSYENQYPDGCIYSRLGNGNPTVHMRDADSALGSFSLILGDYQGQRTDSFYFSGLGDYNNKWDQIWNSCVH